MGHFIRTKNTWALSILRHWNFNSLKQLLQALLMGLKNSPTCIGKIRKFQQIKLKKAPIWASLAIKVPTWFKKCRKFRNIFVNYLSLTGLKKAQTWLKKMWKQKKSFFMSFIQLHRQFQIQLTHFFDEYYQGSAMTQTILNFFLWLNINDRIHQIGSHGQVLHGFLYKQIFWCIVSWEPLYYLSTTIQMHPFNMNNLFCMEKLNIFMTSNLNCHVCSISYIQNTF